MKKSRKIFSESFKKDKVRLYETGKMTISQLSKLYEVSETALYKWVTKYRTTPASQRTVLETDSDYLQLLELQRRVDSMERLIGSQQISIDYHKSILESASAHYGEDVEKKFG